MRRTLSRLWMGLLTVWLLSSAVFFAIRLLPGDPAALVLGELADESSKAALRHSLHLDESLGRQYARFLVGLATLDLGPSLQKPTLTAFGRVAEVFPATAALAFVAVLLGTFAGLAASVLSVGPWLGKGRDFVHKGAVAVCAIPLLAVAPTLTYLLAVRTHLVPLPGDPASGARGLLFASALLSFPLGAQVARIGRAALLDLGRAQFLSAARARGAGEARVWILHALPAASAPIVAVVGTQLGALLGGAVVLERLFERPGLGSLLLEAYATRDLPVLEATLVASASLFVGTQALTSAAHSLLDPRGGES
jgi:peptide/nickel transport system permease protein